MYLQAEWTTVWALIREAQDNMEETDRKWLPWVEAHDSWHVNQKSDYDDDIRWFRQMPAEWIYSVFKKEG